MFTKINFAVDDFDEGSKDNSVFDQLLAINEKSGRYGYWTAKLLNTNYHVEKYMLNNAKSISEKSRSGKKTKFFQGDIILTKSIEEMTKNHKRGAASNNPNHIWPIKNGKHEIPYDINSGK